jgi:hypothetical protein
MLLLIAGVTAVAITMYLARRVNRRFARLRAELAAEPAGRRFSEAVDAGDFERAEIELRAAFKGRATL